MSLCVSEKYPFICPGNIKLFILPCISIFSINNTFWKSFHVSSDEPDTSLILGAATFSLSWAYRLFSNHAPTGEHLVASKLSLLSTVLPLTTWQIYICTLAQVDG